MLAFEVMLPVLLRETVGYEMSACAHDYPGRDRPADREGLIVVQELPFVFQVADARGGPFRWLPCRPAASAPAVIS